MRFNTSRYLDELKKFIYYEYIETKRTENLFQFFIITLKNSIKKVIYYDYITYYYLFFKFIR